MRRLIPVALILLTIEIDCGNGLASREGSLNRNRFVKQSVASIFGGIIGSQTTNAAPLDAAPQGPKILRADKCAYGEGEGCASAAGDNEFIKELQRKSLEKKEVAQKVRS